jgi:hypothetical protein
MITLAPGPSILIAIVSGMLIAFGLVTIWRDRGLKNPNLSRRATNQPPAAQQESDQLADVEIVLGRQTTAHITPPPRPDVAATVIGSVAPPAPPINGGALHALDELRDSLSTIQHEAVDDRPEAQRLPWVEQRWLEMSPVLTAAVGTINDTTERVGLVVGAAGDPSWSFKNRGFGTYRRIMAGNKSVAWLRTELSGQGKFICKIRAHKDDQAQVNSRIEVPSATLTEKAATDTLARCLKPVSEYVAWHATHPGGAQVEPPVAAGFTWNDVVDTADAALQAANGALAQADARLAVLADPAYEPSIDRDRWPLAVEVHGRTVALMHVDRSGEVMEVAVGVADRSRLDLGRRRQAAIEGLTALELAELMASCAWPSIADAHNAAQQVS